MKTTANTLSPFHVAGRALQRFFILFLQQLYEVGFLGTPFFKIEERVQVMCPLERGLN